MDLLSKFYFNFHRIVRILVMYPRPAVPGMIGIFAFIDAGGITDFAATGVKPGLRHIFAAGMPITTTRTMFHGGA
jgi:hypothetical protein